ncbi:hypothetical protein ACJMK2_014642 [Sinanodonta woodiana]|uniref:Uncharacterized protein n=1 Tax=Sinanodonta woodiana TaxID=1069815 RepID=A0ABD3V2J3_SINWO
MKLIQHRLIFIIVCIYALVALYVEVKYTQEIRVIIECDQIFKERKEILIKQQLYNNVIDTSMLLFQTGINSDRNSDLTLVKNLKNGFKNLSILTLITTFETGHDKNSEKASVYNNTWHNWQILRPRVRLLLFTRNTLPNDNADVIYWNLFPIFHYSVSGVPTVKAMFKQAEELYNTHWYGYCNGDILLTEDILETLEYLSSISDTFLKTNFLVIGRRINVLNVTSGEVRKINGIKEIARSRGSLYDIDAVDYFITNRFFPWEKMPEFLIGVSRYNNWIVGHARCDLGIIVIDATETLTAVYQITMSGGYKQEVPNSIENYNSKLIRRYKLPKRFLQGRTTCAEWKTFRTLTTGRIELAKRDDLHKECACMK